MATDPDVSMAEQTLLDPKSPLSHAVFDAKPKSQELIMQDPTIINYKPVRGNAIAGERKQYVLYPPSNAVNELSIKDDIWHRHIPFKKNDFIDICDLGRQRWEQPRFGATFRPRKHGIESSFIGTIGILRTANKLIDIEKAIGVDDSLIHIDFKRNLQILCDVLSDEMQWPDTNERLILCGFTDFFNAPLMLDCTDCKLKHHHSRVLSKMVYSWKCDQAYRNMVVCDNKCEISACASCSAGWTSDQGVLTCCNFFTHGTLSANENVLVDGGFWGNNDFPTHRPYTQVETDIEPDLQSYTSELAGHRQKTERLNGVMKKMWHILEQPFRFQHELFPLVFRACCLLTNRYFRLYGYPIKF